jgi:hypothetical protein
MNEVKHTPGPWTLEESTPGQGFHEIRGSDGSCVVAPDDGWDSNYRDYDARLANARLIAAAPDLLSALKELRDMATALMRACHDCDSTQEAIEVWDHELEERGLIGVGAKAEAVIAKAEGRG